MDTDIPKDSNMNMSLIARALDLVQEKLHARGLPMPQNVWIQADNTCREGRNQWLWNFCSWLVTARKMRSAQQAFLLLVIPNSIQTNDFQSLQKVWLPKAYLKTHRLILIPSTYGYLHLHLNTYQSSPLIPMLLPAAL